MSSADSHRYFEEMAVTHVLGGLDQSEGKVFRSHLLDCADCRARVGELRALASELADVEREERRERAARAVGTKRRESDDDELIEDDFVPASRGSRIALVGGLILVMLLAAWNFTLRSRIELAQTFVTSTVTSTALLLEGEQWTVDSRVDQLSAVVAMQGGQFAIMVSGLQPGEDYGVFLQGTDGEVAFRFPLRVNGAAPVVAGPYDLPEDPRDAAKLVITDSPGSEVKGHTLLVATPTTSGI